MTLTRAAEVTASLLGLAGMALGTTTLYGAACYLVGIPILVYAVVWKRKAYGLMPLNLAQMAVTIFNFWRALP